MGLGRFFMVLVLGVFATANMGCWIYTTPDLKRADFQELQPISEKSSITVEFEYQSNGKKSNFYSKSYGKTLQQVMLDSNLFSEVKVNVPDEQPDLIIVLNEKYNAGLAILNGVITGITYFIVGTLTPSDMEIDIIYVVDGQRSENKFSIESQFKIGLISLPPKGTEQPYRLYQRTLLKYIFINALSDLQKTGRFPP